MRVYEITAEFGWEGDDGLGDRLIQQIIDGTKTATCGFKAAYSANELTEILGNKGTVITVVDHSGIPRCNIRILDVFETPFGDPDMRLVRGEGDGEDVAKFQADHAIAWQVDFGSAPLSANEMLVVELFELVEVAGD
jgi:uncharacterized protein YhfF